MSLSHGLVLLTGQKQECGLLGRGADMGSQGGDKPLWPQEVHTVAPAAFQMPLGLCCALSRAYEERQVRSAGTDTAGPVCRPLGHKWEVGRSRDSYLVGSGAQRSRGDRGSGCPRRCPRVDRAHGASRGSPCAHTGLLRAKAP